MTRDEFVSQLPPTIDHRLFGPGELRMLSDVDDMKGAWYYHENSSTRGAILGDSWEDVYHKLSRYLKQQGLIK